MKTIEVKVNEETRVMRADRYINQLYPDMTSEEITESKYYLEDSQKAGKLMLIYIAGIPLVGALLYYLIS